VSVDTTLRQLERRDPAAERPETLRALMRAGRAPWAGCRVACEECGGTGTIYHGDIPFMCHPCQGTGQRPLTNDEALSLAAYVGHSGARALAPGGDPCPECGQEYSCVAHGGVSALHSWLSGLQRFPAPVLLRAALGAAEAALLAWEEDSNHYRDWCRQCGAKRPIAEWRACRTCEELTAPRRALDACRAYLDDPSEENRVAWDRAFEEMETGPGGRFWIPGPQFLTADEHVGTITWAAAHLTSEDTARARCCTKVLRWVGLREGS